MIRPKKTATKKHYFLICGTLMLASGDGEISTVSLNAIVPNDIKNFTVASIGLAQQALQANFAERMQGSEDPLPQVVDIVVASVSYLGHMTPEQFQKPPEGMELAERQDPLPAADNDPFK